MHVEGGHAQNVNLQVSIQPLHRLATVRQSERISRRTMARRLHTSVRKVRLQEDESRDLPLSALYQWAAVLDVPVTELLIEPDDALSPPVMKRAQLLQLMKTARAIVERGSLPVRRMAEMLIGQLLEVMPELKDVTPWPAVGREQGGIELRRLAEWIVPWTSLRLRNSGHE
jgi:transcriptional regulator with XRE-family HTH domain